MVSGRNKRPGPPLRRSARATASPITPATRLQGVSSDLPVLPYGVLLASSEPMSKSTSLWIDSTHRPSTSPLNADAAADVCIVGAGIAGLTTGYLLAREGASVAVVDVGGVGNG